MPNPISALNRTNEAARASAPASPTMDRDGFLKLLVAQLSHQDPLQPTEGTEFVTQLSQFALVEQSITQSNQLNVISTQVRGLSNNEAAGLVGQTVTIRGHGVAFDGAAATTSNVQLGAAAGRVTATLRDANGRVVRTMDIGARQAGAGFGGCMVAFVEDGQLEAFAAAVRAHYFATTAIKPDIYPVSAAAGAGLL